MINYRFIIIIIVYKHYYILLAMGCQLLICNVNASVLPLVEYTGLQYVYLILFYNLDAGKEGIMFTIKLYHGGVVVLDLVLDQFGMVEYFDYWYGDQGSVVGSIQIVKSLRCDDKKVEFWFKYGDVFAPKIRKLNNDY